MINVFGNVWRQILYCSFGNKPHSCEEWNLTTWVLNNPINILLWFLCIVVVTFYNSPQPMSSHVQLIHNIAIASILNTTWIPPQDMWWTCQCHILIMPLWILKRAWDWGPHINKAHKLVIVYTKLTKKTTLANITSIIAILTMYSFGYKSLIVKSMH
jgi:hypothetical protein